MLKRSAENMSSPNSNGKCIKTDVEVREQSASLSPRFGRLQIDYPVPDALPAEPANKLIMEAELAAMDLKGTVGALHDVAKQCREVARICREEVEFLAHSNHGLTPVQANDTAIADLTRRLAQVTAEKNRLHIENRLLKDQVQNMRNHVNELDTGVANVKGQINALDRKLSQSRNS